MSTHSNNLPIPKYFWPFLFLDPLKIFEEKLQLSTNDFLNLCLKNAAKGYGLTKPNPMVGSVLVDSSQKIYEHYHTHFGGPHAERNLLENLPMSVTKNATLYCNLEPCQHSNKKTQPCVPLIIKSQIKKVVIASEDNNPSVSGKGIIELRSHGIEVELLGIANQEATYLNRTFFISNKRKRPYIHLKLATTLDNCFASDQDSNTAFITNEKSRELVQWIRAGVQSILIGGKTLRTDNPKLTVRLEHFNKDKHFKQPNRIIFSSQRIDKTSNYHLFNDESSQQTSIVGLVSPNELKEWLSLQFENGITSMLIEGGPGLQQLFLEEDLFDEISFFIAPQILGGNQKLFFKKPRKIEEALSLRGGRWYQLDEDLCFHYIKK